MTVVSNDPIWWPLINATLIASYFIVAASVAVMYDWVLTLGQEVELIWRQRWSLMTFLYLSVRYAGIGYAVYVWMFKPLMSRSLFISHNQDVHACRSSDNFDDRYRVSEILEPLVDFT
ncbi:hypothetical protein BD769DRAFT_465029 [Suillus cothurnatus]|nr:hypothetical protein BD769DRAFT_465029 [Suillus cothurnatus]